MTDRIQLAAFSAAGLVILTLLVLLRTLRVIHYTHSTSTSPKPKTHRAKDDKATLAIFLGSGGHTAEMMRLLAGVDWDRYSNRIYIISSGDSLSEMKALTLEKSISTGSFTIYRIPRARRVLQSYLTSPFTTLYSLAFCLWLIALAPLSKERRRFADVILLNGPGSCVPIACSAFILRVLGLPSPSLVYIESLARTRRLSLSAKIVRLMVDRFFVQWESLRDSLASERTFAGYKLWANVECEGCWLSLALPFDVLVSQQHAMLRHTQGHHLRPIATILRSGSPMTPTLTAPTPLSFLHRTYSSGSTLQLLPPYQHDGIVHNPLGGGSYLFKSNFVEYQLGLARRTIGFPNPSSSDSKVKSLTVHVGAQPNNSPHVGTLVTFALAVQLAKQFELKSDLDVTVALDLVDTAPDSDLTGQIPQGYQKSLRYTGGIHRHLDDYQNILAYYGALAGGISTIMTAQGDLALRPSSPAVVRHIVKNRKWLGPLISPEKKILGLRAACPSCGLADKPGLRNIYHDNPGHEWIDFACPDHGTHHVDLRDPLEFLKLEYNAPLRNLVRALILSSAPEDEAHLRVTGGDYAGGYQENLLLRPWTRLASFDGSATRIHRTPQIIYAPLIQDWAGSKLSKSLYIRKGGYEYLKRYGLDYLLSLEKMWDMAKDPKVVFDEVGRWVQEPKKLFRSYSVEYLHSLFEAAEGR